MVRKGERYRTKKPLKVTAMTHWAAPFTGGKDGIFPAGEEFVISSDPSTGATGVYCDPVRYEELHARFVPAEDRKNRRYGGYYLCVAIADILADCEKTGPSPSEPGELSSATLPQRPWERERQSVEEGGAIGVLVPLIGRGPEEYRLVPADEAGPMLFRLLGSVPPGEVWAFQPGDVVHCILKVFSLDEPAELLAVERTIA